MCSSRLVVSACIHTFLIDIILTDSAEYLITSHIEVIWRVFRLFWEHWFTVSQFSLSQPHQRLEQPLQHASIVGGREGEGVCEVRHGWSHALMTPKECSSQTKIFFFLTKTKFQYRSHPLHSMFNYRFFQVCRNHRAQFNKTIKMTKRVVFLWVSSICKMLVTVAVTVFLKSR